MSYVSKMSFAGATFLKTSVAGTQHASSSESVCSGGSFEATSPVLSYTPQIEITKKRTDFQKTVNIKDFFTPMF